MRFRVRTLHLLKSVPGVRGRVPGQPNSLSPSSITIIIVLITISNSNIISIFFSLVLCTAELPSLHSSLYFLQFHSHFLHFLSQRLHSLSSRLPHIFQLPSHCPSSHLSAGLRQQLPPLPHTNSQRPHPQNYRHPCSGHFRRVSGGRTKAEL